MYNIKLGLAQIEEVYVKTIGKQEIQMKRVCCKELIQNTQFIIGKNLLLSIRIYLRVVKKKKKTHFISRVFFYRVINLNICIMLENVCGNLIKCIYTNVLMLLLGIAGAVIIVIQYNHFPQCF